MYWSTKITEQLRSASFLLILRDHGSQRSVPDSMGVPVPVSPIATAWQSARASQPFLPARLDCSRSLVLPPSSRAPNAACSGGFPDKWDPWHADHPAKPTIAQRGFPKSLPETEAIFDAIAASPGDLRQKDMKQGIRSKGMG
jgi:hypothetical protein